MTQILKKIKWISLIVTILAFTGACSQQTRSNDWNPSQEELQQGLDDLVKSAELSGFSAEAGDIKDRISGASDGAVSYFYGEGEKSGPTPTVVAINDFTFFADTLVYSYLDVASAKVLLVDTVNETGRIFELIFQVSFHGEEKDPITFYHFAESYEFTDNSVKIFFPDFVLQSNDVVDGDFKGIIKLTLLTLDQNEIIGQFSSLVNFLPL